MIPPNFYTETGLDRMSERRSDEDWIAGLLRAGGTVVIPVWRGRNLVVGGGEAPRAARLSTDQIAAFIAEGAHAMFLGFREGAAHFAVDLSHLDAAPAALADAAGAEFTEIRTFGHDLPREDGAILAYVKALANWHRTHRFCGRCGHATEPREAGHVRRCTNPDCEAMHFPRSDPAVIMLISRGDKAVLGRKKEWAPGRFSVLAGFVEHGESLEGAVAREVMEEVGLPVSNVRYHSSQPWPFPASLMLGYFAHAEADDLKINREELEDARWFTRAELIDEARAFAARPNAASIARRLIADWANGNEP